MVEPSELAVLLRGGDPRGIIPDSWKKIEPNGFREERKNKTPMSQAFLKFFLSSKPSARFFKSAALDSSRCCARCSVSKLKSMKNPKSRKMKIFSHEVDPKYATGATAIM
ncbi:MAG: hypothetical protein EOP06_04795 [Proteobacteria bacterium]|nr:MAG: hypothetical protein EOP06_04795 [Pseudomonadota bacterium]